MKKYTNEELIEVLEDVRDNNQWDFDEAYYSFQQGMVTHEERMESFQDTINAIIEIVKMK